MKAALIGLLQSGKSTILSAVSGKALHAPGSVAIEEAIVPVPDERLDWLFEYYKPKKEVHATIDCLDVPGLNFADEHGRAAGRPGKHGSKGKKSSVSRSSPRRPEGGPP